ncbi:hypothetical protein CWI37_2222p0010 [Hamiltosporidium tvaerminnensis]|uniref:Uncharacterized protein n=1 Tax=Hamiltosporidium tvaerminnensis TaxID=1176355 RepID=A0A4Q9KS15_9MICR|nr:hypothetical protein CWI37_2222p0010 [Hamiltosporidium tvaerminnensis]
MCCMRISYDGTTDDNSEVKENINEILKEINCKHKDQMLEIASYYFNKIKDYTKKELHPFLRHFTTIICCIVYNNCSEEEYKAYHPELLFNLICFGRFVEMYTENKEYNDIVKKIFEGLLSVQTGLFSNENFHRCLKDKYEDSVPVILGSFDKGDETDLEFLKNTKIIFDENSNHYLIDSLSNATFEKIFCFLGYFKRYCFYQVVRAHPNSGVYDNSWLESFRLDYYINSGEHAINMIESDEILIRNMNCMFNDQQYKVIIQFISEKIVAKVLNNQSRVDEIFEFNENISKFQNKPEDLNFPRVFLELLCIERNVIFIKTLYDFLKEKTTEEYHKYISGVLCLKALCLEKEIVNEKEISRIIIEFLFLADVLKTEFEKIEKIEIIKKYRKECIDGFKQIFDQKKIEYIKNQGGDYLNCNKVPKTTILLEIYCFVELFSKDSFKKFLDKRINAKMFKEEKEIFANDSKIKESYLKKIFENEISTLSSEGKKRLFCLPGPESPNPDPESKKSDGFGIKEIIFYILLPILAVSGIFIVGYLLLYKKR